MTPRTMVHVVVPDGIDDPAHPSGGNVYDRRICRGLGEIGWSVAELPVPGAWPHPDPAAHDRLADLIATIPDGAVVLLDGLVASAAARVLVPNARRLRLVVLMHMPLGESEPDPQVGSPTLAEIRSDEAAVLGAAAAIIPTSTWTRDRLLLRYAVRADAMHVAEPGVDAAGLAPGTAAGGELLCVAAVAPHKGHDLLVDALGRVADLDWRCTFVGATDREPTFVHRLRSAAGAAGVGDRLRFTGPLCGVHLDAAYASADLLVLASHAETYGMVATEALARGIPVIATRVGGLPAALGRATDGRSPGLLVPRGDIDGFAAALRNWLSDPGLRGELRAAATQRRATLTDWGVTSRRISDVLSGVAA